MAARQIQVLNPILAYWRGEFSGFEGNKEDNWRWCGSDGELQLENSFVRPRRIQIEMTLSTANPGKLRFSSPFFNAELSLDNQPQPFSQSFELPPGKHSILFFCDSQRAQATQDPRELVLRVNNFKLTELY
jgi:hypothetical protein